MRRALDRLPPPLAPLAEIAWNLWWTWTPGAQDLFRRLDGSLWESSGHNPVKVLLHTPEETVARAAADGSYAAEVRRIHEALRAFLAATGRMADRDGAEERAPAGFKVAYFCAEFGLHECLPIYCGGLGLLAGDHLKSAAQLGLPMVGVGLLYSHGFFRQRLDESGGQQEEMPYIEPDELPIQRVPDAATGRQLRVTVEFPGRAVHAAVWRCDVGNVPLYLLDTDLPENAEADRHITRNLYLGDHHQRVKQEIILGVGGVRALEVLGERATVFHMNEGHSAFLALERIAKLRESAAHELSFDQVREAATAAHLFTTHTPVPAGIDRFHPELVRPFFMRMLPRIGLNAEGFLALGRENVADRSEMFSMAVLALRTSRWANGVSRLHGAVSRRMWRNIWPGTPEPDIPIGHVTNGVHPETWIAPELAALFDKHLGEKQRWRTHPDDPAAWAGVESIPDAELWAAHMACKARLLEFCRRRAAARPDLFGAVAAAGLDPEALTIGFARRFAPYKRATLLFRDLPRLRRLLAGPRGRKVQILIAGKAYPSDEIGKAMVREVLRLAREEGLAGHILFLEDYDIDVARHLVQGVDVWLNNPIRPMEASGTSGMKAAMNGGINCSILDGWWDEAYAPEIGFAIGSRSHALDQEPATRDEAESLALFHTLEEQVVPEFFDRPQADGAAAPLPRQWIARMKRSIAALAPRFSTHRMVAEYARRYYFPAHRAAAALSAGGLADARAVSDHIDRWRAHWHGVRIASAVASRDGSSGSVQVSADVSLGGLSPDEVEVQAYRVEPGDVEGTETVRTQTLTPTGPMPGGVPNLMRFTGRVDLEATSDLHGLAVRIVPRDPRLITPFIPGLIVNEPVALAGV